MRRDQMKAAWLEGNILFLEKFARIVKADRDIEFDAFSAENVLKDVDGKMLKHCF